MIDNYKVDIYTVVNSKSIELKELPLTDAILKHYKSVYPRNSVNFDYRLELTNEELERHKLVYLILSNSDRKTMYSTFSCLHSRPVYLAHHFSYSRCILYACEYVDTGVYYTAYKYSYLKSLSTVKYINGSINCFI